MRLEPSGRKWTADGRLGAHVLSFFGISLPVVQLGGGLIVISTGWAMLNQKDGDDRAARRTVTCADAVSQAFLSIAICSSFKSPSIWRSETFPRLLLCNSDCSLAVSRASTSGGPRQKNVDLTLEKIFNSGEGQHLRFRTFRTDFFNLFNHPSFFVRQISLQQWLRRGGQDWRRSVPR